MISAMKAPMNIAMQFEPGITIAMPMPFGDGMYGFTFLAENFSAIVRSTPIVRPTMIAHFVESCMLPMPPENASDTPAQTRHDGAGHSSVPSSVVIPAAFCAADGSRMMRRNAG